jgi:hypothetical protein
VRHEKVSVEVSANTWTTYDHPEEDEVGTDPIFFSMHACLMASLLSDATSRRSFLTTIDYSVLSCALHGVVSRYLQLALD